MATTTTTTTKTNPNPNPNDPPNISIITNQLVTTTTTFTTTILIREVWANNIDFEFKLIGNLLDKYPYISMDTEFPGVVFWPIDGGDPYTKRNSPETHYSLLKQNVDALKLIQLGLTLTDCDGNLPDLGTKKNQFMWQFNFKDFDVARDPHAPDSVELLRNHGIDFEKNHELGIDSVRFGELMMSSGLVCNGENVTWVTFHGAYDFGYVVKVLTQRPLPGDLGQFLELLRVFFGERVYDVKYMIKFCNGLYGGLDRVATALQLDREVGRSHQSGSDSLLTWRVFQTIRDAPYFRKIAGGLDVCSSLLYGLETS